MEKPAQQRVLQGKGKTRTGAILVLGGTLFMLILAALLAGGGQEKVKTPPPQDKPPVAWTMESHDRTNFPLTGKHRTLVCVDCHVNKVFEGTPTACEACHWQRRQDDRYRLRLGMNCAECHTPATWKKVDPNKWNHETQTGFKLEGVHQFVDCEMCHGLQGFKAPSTDCYGCHSAEYRSTRDPNHVQAGFPTDCRACHDTRSWGHGRFAHAGFPLAGRHATLACSDCHKNGVYAGTPTDCASCHIDDYNATTDPNHRQAGFPTDCTVCHGRTFTGWSGATFVHTAWPLQGRHATAACADCHQNGVYAGTSTACASCHINNYNSTTDPNHRALGYSLECQTCHGTSYTGWEHAPRP